MAYTRTLSSKTQDSSPEILTQAASPLAFSDLSGNTHKKPTSLCLTMEGTLVSRVATAIGTGELWVNLCKLSGV